MAETLRRGIEQALQQKGWPIPNFVVEHPADVAHGHYATNVAFILAKQLGDAPRTVAESLLPLLQAALPDVEMFSVAGPGFINMTLPRSFFTSVVESVIADRDTWGSSTQWREKELMIEYTSPNLFKPLHIGNLVGNIVGESLARIAEFSGAHVKRCNYPSDIGLTVAKGVWGLTQTQGDPRDIAALGEAYRFGNEAYEAGGEAKEAIEAVNRSLYAGNDAALAALREAGLATSKARLVELLAILGTSFDIVVYESEASIPGLQAVRAATPRVFTESNGAVVYEGEKDGLHTRVFINSQGLPTYEAKDVGNFLLKAAQYPVWNHSMVVTGNEQTEYFKVLFAALRALFPEARERMLEHVATGFLTLTTGKMSSRKGNVLTGESLIEELRDEARERAQEARTDDVDTLTRQVAVAALKYQILRQSVGANIVFDKAQALSFEGDSGPYLQYTYARIMSVLEKAREVGIVPATDNPLPVVAEVETILYRFPEAVEEALLERSPHKITHYLAALAGAFNTLYSQERFADATDALAPYKLALATATAHTLKNGLWLLGIEVPERM